MLASVFGNPTVLTRALMREIFGMNDKTKMKDKVNDLRSFKIGLENFHCIMNNQGCHVELDSDSVWRELFVRLPYWLQHKFEKNCREG